MTRYGPEYRGRTALYRLYDATDRLLYVGVARKPDDRLYTHQHTQYWWAEVTRKELVWLDTRAEAEQAEREAIHDEKPIYNKNHREGKLAESERRAQFDAYVAKVAQAVEQDIRTKAFPPSTVIPERSLAERYGLPADAIHSGLRSCASRGIITSAHPYWIAQDTTFPIALARKYTVLYALAFQAFGQDPFTVAEVQERTRLTLGRVQKGLAELRDKGLAKVVGHRKQGRKAPALWALSLEPPKRPLREPLDLDLCQVWWGNDDMA